jgi:hypothetical protein
MMCSADAGVECRVALLACSMVLVDAYCTTDPLLQRPLEGCSHRLPAPLLLLLLLLMW